MISNSVIQKSLDEIKAITRIDMLLYDPSGKLVAGPDGADAKALDLKSFVDSQADSQSIGKHHLLKVSDDEETVYILDAISDASDVYMVAKLAVSQLQNLILAYKERLDRDNFFQNLLLDNMLTVDIYNKAKKLHINAEANKLVFVVETQKRNDTVVREVLKSMFAVQSGNVVTAVDEENIVVIRSVDADYDEAAAIQDAEAMVAILSTEAMVNARVAFGGIVSELGEVSKSYKEAKLALEVGKIFYANRQVSSYSSLGIGRLIYQLPTGLCRMFVEEIFGDNGLNDLDEEALGTIDKFFENNLNISETSRQLFIHRNTLVYRIEKIQKATGLDLRNFDDALVFKMALMVLNFMNYNK